jgi:hypothetical protein
LVMQRWTDRKSLKKASLFRRYKFEIKIDENNTE